MPFHCSVSLVTAKAYARPLSSQMNQQKTCTCVHECAHLTYNAATGAVPMHGDWRNTLSQWTRDEELLENPPYEGYPGSPRHYASSPPTPEPHFETPPLYEYTFTQECIRDDSLLSGSSQAEPEDSLCIPESPPMSPPYAPQSPPIVPCESDCKCRDCAQSNLESKGSDLADALLSYADFFENPNAVGKDPETLDQVFAHMRKLANNYKDLQRAARYKPYRVRVYFSFPVSGVSSDTSSIPVISTCR